MSRPTTKLSIPKKELFFAEGVIWSVIIGETDRTLRNYKPGVHDFSKGEIVQAVCRDGFTILLEITEDTVLKPWNEVTLEEARAHGYTSPGELIKDFKIRFYPNLDEKQDKLAIIFIKIPEIDGTATISPNEHLRVD